MDVLAVVKQVLPLTGEFMVLLQGRSNFVSGEEFSTPTRWLDSRRLEQP